MNSNARNFDRNSTRPAQPAFHPNPDLPPTPERPDTPPAADQSSLKPSLQTDTIRDGVGSPPITEGFTLNVAPEPLPLPRLGRYELRERLGGGGMGVVFRVYDPELRREVALKTIRDGAFAEKEDIERFVHEAQAIARLKHPHIISILDIGRDQGYHYFTMPLATGGALSDRVGDFANGDPRAAVMLVAKTARGVHFAHENKVLHRDLKPANILLDENDEPLVSDFGLVKFLDCEFTMTQAGKAMGTRPYMSPEQLAGLKEKITCRTDIWGLGILLYELLTDHRPFDAPSEERLTELIRDENPPSPRLHRPQIDERLEGIILKCLRKDPEDRYASALELANDLDRWLSGEPVQAELPTRRERLGRWLARQQKQHHGRWLGAAVALLVVLATGTWLAIAAPWRHDSPTGAGSPEDGLAAAERWVRSIPDQLAAGKSVTLIGVTGGPKWSRWAAGNRKTPPEAEEIKPFYFAAWDLSLLELVPNPGMGPYRFRAEVRHLDGQPRQQVGLYLAQTLHPTEGGWVNTFVDLCFDDNSRWPNHPKGNTIDIRASLLIEPRQKGLSWYYHSKPVFYDPYPERDKPWRSLAFEVYPDRLKGFWERKLVHEVSWEDLNQKANFALSKHITNGKVAQLQGAMFNILPNQPLGLYVSASEAEFRNVVLEPIPSP